MAAPNDQRDRLLKQIAQKFNGIYCDQLSQKEREIARSLCEALYLQEVQMPYTDDDHIRASVFYAVE